MTTYWDQSQFPSSSSHEESQVVLGVLSSPSTDYYVQSLLGQGVFGQVTKCLKVATKETVAIKIIKNTSFTPEADNEVAILQELRAFDSDRFNFVRCNDAFFDRGHVCLEFEMLDVSLMDFLKKKPTQSLSVKEIRPILQQVATSLQLLKCLGLVHTDFKPDNIMMVDCVNQPLRIKIIDFGLACHVSRAEWGLYIQVRYYRSPEVILGIPFTAAIDMWSLGCIAAELFLGHVLYPGCSEYDMLQHMVQTQGQLPQRLLNYGIKTCCFFKRKRWLRKRRWKLKTPFEYGQATWSESYFSCLEDLMEVKPVCHLSDEDKMAEIEDQENFVEMLKKMLHLDADKRITPSELLEDPFITMCNFAESCPNSFYVTTCCEMMKVCQDQSPWLNPQASTSAASLDQHNVSHQAPLVWHTRQEHPLILASAVSSCLSIHGARSVCVCAWSDFSTHEEVSQPELQLPVTSEEAQTCTGKIKPVRKRKRDTVQPSLRSDRSLESAVPERKRMKMDVDSFEIHNDLLKSSEVTSSTAKAKPRRKRKRKRDIFIGWRRRKRRNRWKSKRKRMRLLCDSRQAPSKDPTITAESKPQRKRKWPTSTSVNDRPPDSASPERKRRKMSPDGVLILEGSTLFFCQELPQNSREAPTEATCSTAKAKPQRKRKRDIFIEWRRRKRRNRWKSKRKRMRLLCDSREAPSEDPAIAAESKPQRKRKWPTSTSVNSRSPDSASPERKRRKMSPDGVLMLEGSTLFFCQELPQNSREALTEATSSTAKAKPQRKRKWPTSTSVNSRPPDSTSLKRRKLSPDGVLTLEEMPHNSNQASSSNETQTRRKRKRNGCTG